MLKLVKVVVATYQKKVSSPIDYFPWFLLFLLFYRYCRAVWVRIQQT